jgi:hypothetical protein
MSEITYTVLSWLAVAAVIGIVLVIALIIALRVIERLSKKDE